MDDRTDRALYDIEKKIKRNGDPRACDYYEKSSEMICLCLNCGWDHEAHKEVTEGCTMCGETECSCQFDKSLEPSIRYALVKEKHRTGCPVYIAAQQGRIITSCMCDLLDAAVKPIFEEE
jgi:hypothetical protein